MRHFETDEAYLRWLSEASEEEIDADIEDVLAEIDLPEEETHGAE